MALSPIYDQIRVLPNKEHLISFVAQKQVRIYFDQVDFMLTEVSRFYCTYWKLIERILYKWHASYMAMYINLRITFLELCWAWTLGKIRIPDIRSNNEAQY